MDDDMYVYITPPQKKNLHRPGFHGQLTAIGHSLRNPEIKKGSHPMKIIFPIKSTTTET